MFSDLAHSLTQNEINRRSQSSDADVIPGPAFEGVWQKDKDRAQYVIAVTVNSPEKSSAEIAKEVGVSPQRIRKVRTDYGDGFEENDSEIL